MIGILDLWPKAVVMNVGGQIIKHLNLGAEINDSDSMVEQECRLSY